MGFHRWDTCCMDQTRSSRLMVFFWEEVCLECDSADPLCCMQAECSSECDPKSGGFTAGSNCLPGYLVSAEHLVCRACGSGRAGLSGNWARLVNTRLTPQRMELVGVAWRAVELTLAWLAELLPHCSVYLLNKCRLSDCSQSADPARRVVCIHTRSDNRASLEAYTDLVLQKWFDMMSTKV